MRRATRSGDACSLSCARKTAAGSVCPFRLRASCGRSSGHGHGHGHSRGRCVKTKEMHMLCRLYSHHSAFNWVRLDHARLHRKQRNLYAFRVQIRNGALFFGFFFVSLTYDGLRHFSSNDEALRACWRHIRRLIVCFRLHPATAAIARKDRKASALAVEDSATAFAARPAPTAAPALAPRRSRRLRSGARLFDFRRRGVDPVLAAAAEPAKERFAARLCRVPCRICCVCVLGTQTKAANDDANQWAGQSDRNQPDSKHVRLKVPESTVRLVRHRCANKAPDAFGVGHRFFSLRPRARYIVSSNASPRLLHQLGSAIMVDSVSST